MLCRISGARFPLLTIADSPPPLFGFFSFPKPFARAMLSANLKTQIPTSFSATAILLGILWGASGKATSAEQATKPSGFTHQAPTAVVTTPSASITTNGVARGVSFQRGWKRAELLPVISDLSGGRNFTQGSEVFTKAMCGTCHAFGRISLGNGISPDLTGVGSRYSRDVILDSILTPSLVLNGRFPATELRLRNGEVMTGTLVDLTDDKYVIAESPFHPEATTTIPRADVILEQPSTTSPMPEGLLDSFTAEQIRDLFAFLDAQGDPDARVFKSVSAPKSVPRTQP